MGSNLIREHGMPMRPTLRSEIFGLPRILRETLGKRRREYDTILRRALSSETPLTFVGSPLTLALAESMAGGFESLLEWPCAIRSASEFDAGDAGRIRPGSIFFLIPEDPDSTELTKVADRIRSQEGLVLAMVVKPECPLGHHAEGVLVVRAGETPGRVALPIAQQAIAGYLALLAARAVKRPHPRFDALEKEFGLLPDHIDRALAQHTEGVRSLAREIARARSMTIVGAGSYQFPARQAVELLGIYGGIAARFVSAADAAPQHPSSTEAGSSLLVLTGSRCGDKTGIQSMVRAAKREGKTVFSLTDGNDSEISRNSRMTLLLPPLDEITGAVLAHVLVGWIAYEASRLSLVDRAK